MNRLSFIFFLFLFSWLADPAFLHAEIVTYPVPPSLLYSRHNDDFTVKVRHPGEKWIDLYEYNVKVDMDTNSDASMAHFDFSGVVEVLVQKNNGDVRSVSIRPLSKGITPVIEGNTVLFTLDRPQNLSIEFNGDKLHNLHLFAGAIERDIPDKNSPDVIWFEPGVHQPDENMNGTYIIPSNTTVYLEGGAVVKGKLACENVENIRIYGRGILLEPAQGISVHHSRNVTIEGIIVLNPQHYTVSGGESTGITIRNLKSFSCRGWSDGLDFMSCSDVLIENVFMRNSDDCIAIYGHRWNFYGDVRNYIIRNSTLWADIAHPVNIGTHGNTKTAGEIIENINFQNIDILEHDEDDRDYQGCMTINVGDNNLARNITFEHIRVERIEEGQLFHLRVMYNEKYNTAPGRGIENITFRNISYNGKYENPSVIKGYDKNRKIRGIMFENIIINGVKATDPEKMNLEIGPFVENLQIK